MSSDTAVKDCLHVACRSRREREREKAPWSRKNSNYFNRRSIGNGSRNTTFVSCTSDLLFGRRIEDLVLRRDIFRERNICLALLSVQICIQLITGTRRRLFSTCSVYVADEIGYRDSHAGIATWACLGRGREKITRRGVT